MPRLTISVDEDLLNGELSRPIRAREERFLAELDQRLPFRVTWMAPRDLRIQLRISPNGIGIQELPSLGVRRGDLIVLRYRESPQSYQADLLDGSAVFLNHVLSRADIRTLSLLTPMMPTEIVERVSNIETRFDYERLRDQALELLLEQVLRGPASARRFAAELNRWGMTLGFATTDNDWVDFREMIPVEAEENIQGSLIPVLLAAREVFGRLPSGFENAEQVRELIQAFSSGRGR